MEFNELIADFAARHNVPGLAAEDGMALLDIDGIPLTLVSAGDRLAVSAVIGEPPAEGAAAFAGLLLERNLESAAFFARSAETGQYIAVRHLSLSALDSAAFDGALEALVTLAETWRKRLADFRPPVERPAEEKAESPAFGTGGFLQV